jgi:hypothetical protein
MVNIGGLNHKKTNKKGWEELESSLGNVRHKNRKTNSIEIH